MSQTNKQTTNPTALSKAEKKIIEDIRQVKFGRVEIFIQNGKPFRKEVTEQRRIMPEDGGSAGESIKKQSAVEV
jgi:hypothetical protein